DVLPRLLATLGIADCVLVGHSDGGTIALNYAARDPDPLRAVVTLAAHSVNEPVCVASIVKAREAFAAGELRQRLAKYHGDNVDRAFHLWSDAWVAPGFQPMDAAQLYSDTVGQRAWASCSCSRARCLSPRRSASMPMKNAAGHLPLVRLAVSSDSAATSSSPGDSLPSRNLAIGPGHWYRFS